MLTHLTIHNLAIVESLELTFYNGMSVLTGETGAGKSILIDALGLTLGERADAGIIRPGASNAEVSLTYELSQLPHVVAWLNENALDAQEDCIIRRVMTKDGRSRCFINGRTVPLGQLRQLGELLINIHGQHQHQSLLKPEHQRTLLDEYARHDALLKEVKTSFQTWQKLNNEFKELSNLQGQQDKLALLKYQIQEIDELGLQENELSMLEQEHKKLAHTEQWSTLCENALLNLQNDLDAQTKPDALTCIHNALSSITVLKSHIPSLQTSSDLLSNALIQLEEAIAELNHFKDTLQNDPERLNYIEQRLTKIHDLARKHRVKAEDILSHHTLLSTEASTLSSAQTHLIQLTKNLEISEQHYLKAAEILSESRKQKALLLEKLVIERLHQLEMPNGVFKIDFSKKQTSQFSASGIDTVEFLVSTNPGLPLQPLRKIASGGELSRLSLAIQVITAQKMTTPTLIFDEVDVGISGKTAEIVGKLMRTLGEKTQVLCVTHLPQVAAQGHNHYKVEKHQHKENTTTHIALLQKSEKIKEIARMLGGITITQHALAHAEEMLMD